MTQNLVKMIFKKIIFGLVLLGLILPGMAQPGQGGSRKDRVEAFKIAFLTRELELTPEEAKVFWPVYGVYQDERKALRKDAKLDRVEARLNFEEMSDKEVEEALNGFMDNKQAEIDLTRKYVAEFKKVLPIRKVAKLYHAETQFKSRLLKQMQQGGQKGNEFPRRGKGRGQGGPRK